MEVHAALIQLLRPLLVLVVYSIQENVVSQISTLVFHRQLDLFVKIMDSVKSTLVFHHIMSVNVDLDFQVQTVKLLPPQQNSPHYLQPWELVLIEIQTFVPSMLPITTVQTYITLIKCQYLHIVPNHATDVQQTPIPQ